MVKTSAPKLIRLARSSILLKLQFQGRQKSDFSSLYIPVAFDLLGNTMTTKRLKSMAADASPLRTNSEEKTLAHPVDVA
jgi:hypothetical protein